MSYSVPQQRGTQHFTHTPAIPGAERQPRRLSWATRLLAGGTYLDAGYAHAVIDELYGSDRRAVVPSFYGVDVGAIGRHALNAKRLNVLRDLALTFTLLVGLVLVPTGAVLWTVVGIWVVLIRWVWRRLSRGAKAGLLFVLFIGWPLAAGLVSVIQAAGSGGAGDSGGGLGRSTTQESTGLWDRLQHFAHDLHQLVDVFAYPAAVFLILILFAIHRYALLSHDLSANVEHVLPAVRNAKLRQRTEAVEAAQTGNITVYSGWSPFIGAGTIDQSWSIVANVADPDDPRRTLIDPVDLRARIRSRISELRDAPALTNERILNLAVDDHVVASGRRFQQDPLIEPRSRRPYDTADESAVDTLVRHSQAGIRCHLRVTVSAVGAAVHDTRGGRLADAEDLEVAASCFIYVAVEGGMLYVEFVSTVMPPIRGQYHTIDALHPVIRLDWLPTLLATAGRGLLSVALPAPLRLLPGLFSNFRLTQRMRRAERESEEFRLYDYGTRVSLRERGAEPDPATYLQLLDATKYGKLIARRVNDAVIDYLQAQGVDVSEYRQSATVIQNQGVIITGGQVSGQIVNASTASSIAQNHSDPR